jgi:hypothetical protein
MRRAQRDGCQKQCPQPLAASVDSSTFMSGTAVVTTIAMTTLVCGPESQTGHRGASVANVSA